MYKINKKTSVSENTVLNVQETLLGDTGEGSGVLTPGVAGGCVQRG